MIARLSWTEFWKLVLWREGNMTVYYLLLRGWAKLGFSEFHLRSLSVLAGVLTLLAIYLLGKELYGRTAGLLAALLLALHSFHIRYSQETRSYALLALTLVFAAYFLVRALRTASDRDWTAFVLLSALSVYVHFFAILVVLAFLCSVLFVPARPAGARRWIRILGLLGLLVAPAIRYLLSHRNIGLIDWIPPPSWPLLARCAAALLGTGGVLGLIYVMTCLGPFLAGGMRFTKSGHEGNSNRVVLPVLWTVLPGLVLLVASFDRPVLIDRYLLMSVPGFVLLASYGVTRLQERWRVSVAAILVLISAVSVQRSFQTYSTENQDWRGAVQYAVRNSEPGDVVVLDNGIVRPVFEYYRQQSNASAPRAYSFVPRGDELIYRDFAGITAARVLDRVAQVHKRVWIFEWGAGNALIPEMERRFRRARAQEFPHLKVRLYVGDPVSAPE